MLRDCRGRGIVVQACRPLTRTERLDDGALRSISAKYDKTPAQRLIRWNLQLGTVPLPKANQRKHLEEDLDVVDFEISDDELGTLSSLNERTTRERVIRRSMGANRLSLAPHPP